MRIEILGESRLVDGDSRRPLPGGLPGRLLQCLILRPNHSIRRSDLAPLLWPDADLDEGLGRLRVTASRLRKALATGAESTSAGPGCLEIETTPDGYRLVADGSSLDSIEFEDLLRQAVEGDAVAVESALGLWRGEPFSGFTASPEVRRQARRLEAVRARLEALTGDVSGCSESSPSSNLVERPRLMETIRPGHGCRLIALTAPSGYGKSTLLSQWLGADGKPFVHLCLTEADNQPGTVWERLGRALLTVAAHPDLADVWAQKMDGVPWQVNDVINLAIDLETPINVALDDLHLVEDASVVSELRRLVHRSPPTVTLAVASRRQLPFPTGRLLAHGEAVLLTADNLAVTPEETGRMAEAFASEPLDPPLLTKLHELSGGSPVAVRREVEALQQVPEEEFATWTPAPVAGPLGTARPRATSAVGSTRATDPESIVEAIRMGNGTRLEEWIASGSQLGPPRRESANLIALGWALASSAATREPAPLFTSRHLHPATRSAIRSLDLLRLGAWARATSAAGATLSALEYGAIGSEMAQAIEWVVHQVRLECAMYTSGPVVNREVSPPGVEPPWWWLLTRETGRRALYAALNGDSTMARESVRIVETAEVDPSWHLLDDGATGTARLLVMASSAEPYPAASAAWPVERADAAGHLPLSVLSRLGLEALLVHRGDRDAADVVVKQVNELIDRSPDLSALLRIHSRRGTEPRGEMLPGLSELTHRERLVLRQLTTERTFAEIATELYLSPHTVRAHARSIYRKLGAKNRFQVSRALKDL